MSTSNHILADGSLYWYRRHPTPQPQSPAFDPTSPPLEPRSSTTTPQPQSPTFDPTSPPLEPRSSTTTFNDYGQEVPNSLPILHNYTLPESCIESKVESTGVENQSLNDYIVVSIYKYALLFANLYRRKRY